MQHNPVRHRPPQQPGFRCGPRDVDAAAERQAGLWAAGCWMWAARTAGAAGAQLADSRPDFGRVVPGPAPCRAGLSTCRLVEIKRIEHWVALLS